MGGFLVTSCFSVSTGELTNHSGSGPVCEFPVECVVLGFYGASNHVFDVCIRLKDRTSSLRIDNK